MIFPITAFGVEYPTSERLVPLEAADGTGREREREERARERARFGTVLSGLCS